MSSSLCHIRRNITVFSIIGLLFYLYAIYERINNNMALINNPLYYYHFFGVALSMIGGVFAYYYYRYQRIPLLRIVIIAVLLCLLWFIGVMYIGSNLTGTANILASATWIMQLIFCKFILVSFVL